MAISRQTLDPENICRIQFANLLSYTWFPALILREVWLGVLDHDCPSFFCLFPELSLPASFYRLQFPHHLVYHSDYVDALRTIFGFSVNFFLLLF